MWIKHMREADGLTSEYPASRTCEVSPVGALLFGFSYTRVQSAASLVSHIQNKIIRWLINFFGQV
jgi:hypothetical protein